MSITAYSRSVGLPLPMDKALEEGAQTVIVVPWKESGRNAHYDYYGDGDSDDDHADVTEKCDAADEGLDLVMMSDLLLWLLWWCGGEDEEDKSDMVGPGA